MKGRKKIPRCTTFNTDSLFCSSRGPLGKDTKEMEMKEKITLTQEELQTLVDRDIEGKIMDEACVCMNVSKTVYAGIYSSARRKLTQSLISGAILTIECQKK